MTLSEFDRRCRGYLRKEAEQWRRTRLLATLQINAHRGENDAPITPEAYMPLYGDPLPEPTEWLAPEQVEADFARLAALDADLIPKNV